MPTGHSAWLIYVENSKNIIKEIYRDFFCNKKLIKLPALRARCFLLGP